MGHLGSQCFQGWPQALSTGSWVGSRISDSIPLGTNSSALSPSLGARAQQNAAGPAYTEPAAQGCVTGPLMRATAELPRV